MRVVEMAMVFGWRRAWYVDRERSKEKSKLNLTRNLYLSYNKLQGGDSKAAAVRLRTSII